MPSSTDSHGAAFGRRRPSLSSTSACPCGGGAFGRCCGPILAGDPAPSAEALMRSRFTAFALGDRHHLEATWHPSTRPARLDLDDSLQWRRLRIIDTEQGRAGDRRGIVEFCAGWRDSRSATSGELHERSRFIFRQDRWWYLDGAVTAP